MIKVSIIGAGMVGGAITHILAQKGLYDLCLIDKLNSKKAEGKAIDIMQSLCIKDLPASYVIKGSHQIQDIKHSDVVIIAASQPHPPQSGHADLLHNNKDMIEELAKHIKKYAPDAFVIVITTPVDSMTWHFQKKHQNFLKTKSLVYLESLIRVDLNIIYQNDSM